MAMECSLSGVERVKSEIRSAVGEGDWVFCQKKLLEPREGIL